MSRKERRSQRRQRRGNYAIVLALCFTVLMSFAALAVDGAWIRQARQMAQNAADASAHAATVELRRSGSTADALSAARSVASLNVVGKTTIDPDTNFSVEFGGWDFSSAGFDSEADYTNAVEVTVARHSGTANGALDLFLAPVMGIKTANILARATAAMRFREIMVVQDVTGSFSGDIAKAKTGNLALLDSLYANQFPGDRVGMILFTGDTEHDANGDGTMDFLSPWTPLTYVDADYSIIRSQWNTLNWCDKDKVPDGSENKNDHILDCRAGGDGTNQGAGLEDAVETFIADGDPASLHVILLISDGLYACYANPKCKPLDRRDYAIEMADYAWENDIHVYTVSFNKSYSSSQTAFLKQLVRGYGRFYETGTGSDLPGILAEIADRIPVALVE